MEGDSGFGSFLFFMGVLVVAFAFVWLLIRVAVDPEVRRDRRKDG